MPFAKTIDCSLRLLARLLAAKRVARFLWIRKTVLRNSAASRGDPQHECVIVFLYTESDCKSYFQTVMTGSCVTPKGMVAVEQILNCPYSNVWSEMSRRDMFESSSAQMLSADFWFKTNEVVRSVGLDTAQRIIIK